MSQAACNERVSSADRRTYTVEEIGKLLGIGRSSAYNLVKEGHFKVVRIGNSIRVSKRSFDAWLGEQTF